MFHQPIDQWSARAFAGLGSTPSIHPLVLSKSWWPSAEHKDQYWYMAVHHSHPHKNYKNTWFNCQNMYSHLKPMLCRERQSGPYFTSLLYYFLGGGYLRPKTSPCMLLALPWLANHKLQCREAFCRTVSSQFWGTCLVSNGVHPALYSHIPTSHHPLAQIEWFIIFIIYFFLTWCPGGCHGACFGGVFSRIYFAHSLLPLSQIFILISLTSTHDTTFLHQDMCKTIVALGVWWCAEGEGVEKVQKSQSPKHSFLYGWISRMLLVP